MFTSSTFPPGDLEDVYSPPEQHAGLAAPVQPDLLTVDSDTRLEHDQHYLSPLEAPPVLTNDYKQKEYDEIKLSPNNKLFAGLLPHAINIQINIPPSEDRKYKETDSYREEKLISVTERPDYKSPLSPEYGLPPKLPSYNPTVTPSLPPYSSPTPTPHLLPHHPPPGGHYQAHHEDHHYDVPTPASIELPHTPHHLISEFRPPHAEYLGEYFVFGFLEFFRAFCFFEMFLHLFGIQYFFFSTEDNKTWLCSPKTSKLSWRKTSESSKLSWRRSPSPRCISAVSPTTQRISCRKGISATTQGSS